jgi:pantothenate kinase type III
MITNRPLIAIDIGNSRIKIANNGEFYASEYDTNWQSLIKKVLDDAPDAILGYSSVNTTIEIQLLKLLEDFNTITRINTVELLSRQNILDYSEISGIGSDRLLGMIGALGNSKPPLVTVDCGTAVTFNVIDSAGKCRGGAIFPGVFTQFQALGNASNALKAIKINFNSEKIGTTTAEAVNLGVISSVIGGIERLLKSTLNEGVTVIESPIYMTGGYAHHLCNYLSSNYPNVILKQDLVLQGIIRLLEDFAIE